MSDLVFLIICLFVEKQTICWNTTNAPKENYTDLILQMRDGPMSILEYQREATFDIWKIGTWKGSLGKHIATHSVVGTLVSSLTIKCRQRMRPLL